MHKTLCAFCLAVIALSSVLSANVSMSTFTGSGYPIISIPLVSINKITFDDYSMYVDTGSTHEIVQQPIAGGAGKVKAVFATDLKIRQSRINGNGSGKFIISTGPSAAVLSFNLASAGFMKVAVYTSKGEQVREIASSRLGAGAHILRWDGAGENGKSAVPGVYHIIGSVDRYPVIHAAIVVP